MDKPCLSRKKTGGWQQNVGYYIMWSVKFLIAFCGVRKANTMLFFAARSSEVQISGGH